MGNWLHPSGDDNVQLSHETTEQWSFPPETISKGESLLHAFPRDNKHGQSIQFHDWERRRSQGNIFKIMVYILLRNRLEGELCSFASRILYNRLQPLFSKGNLAMGRMHRHYWELCRLHQFHWEISNGLPRRRGFLIQFNGWDGKELLC